MPVHPCRTIPRISMYADDVVLFCRTTPADCLQRKRCCTCSNRHLVWSPTMPRARRPQSIALIQKQRRCRTTCGCQLVEFPISYLAIPLTIRRPTSAQVQPMVDRLTNRLHSWKARLKSKPGRLSMVTSALSAIPVHQLLVIVPDKIIKACRTLSAQTPRFASGGYGSATPTPPSPRWL